MSERRRLLVYPDWPCLIGLVAPVLAGVGLGLLCERIRWDDGLAVLIGLFMIVIPLSIAASYWMSCRVADRSGQPWAFISFFVALAGWWFGIVMFFSFAGTFANKG